MDKKQAQQAINDLFSKAFDRERYQFFLRNLLNNYEPRTGHYTGNYIPDAFKQHVKQYWRIGRYVDPEGVGLDLLIVEVRSLQKLERARSALRNFAVNRLKQFEKDASLIAFYAEDDQGADWRFSFIKMEDKPEMIQGKVKLKRELTPAKRYSYLVGVHENTHTASKQLLPLLEMDYADPRVTEIEDTFGIEKVTAEFFEQYKSLFLKLTEHLKKQKYFKQKTEAETDTLVSRFGKKLLGQIVFLYFLQKKGWLGVAKDDHWGNGEKNFMRQRFMEINEEGGNYYHDFLQYLFYEALADERKDQIVSGYYPRFNCKIPFLNGGLFEADYDWQNVKIELPNSLFHNEEKTKSGDTGTGILNVFDRYNFTIKEDEPLEKEVAVDPEMLGKVFENMLEVTERKNKGAFYTPREIVHYMCQESLIHYLDNALNHDSSQRSIQNEDIEILIRKGHIALENDTRILGKGKETNDYKFQLPKAIRERAADIDRALADIKICDPAIGSGAFPVGLLHEIVNTRLALAPHSNNGSSPYELKRHAISESIYGVDMDASAIDIARLRLWLSLIVDEEDYGSIDALPNLDYKIVQGNALLGIELDLFNQSLLNDLEKLKKVFFDTTDHDSKVKLMNKINDLIHQVTEGKSLFDFKVYFSEVWHYKGGFDVVVGNPPYVQIQRFSGKQIQKELEKQNYSTFAKTGDIYCLFYEKGYRLLSDNGVLAYITSNKWMRAGYGEKLRRFFNEETQPLMLIDFSSFQVFEAATVDTNVLIFRKQKRESPVPACLVDSSFSRSIPLATFVNRNCIDLDDLTSDSWVITGKEEYAIKKKIEKIGMPLKKWNIGIYRGILTGFNEAFIIDGKKRNALISEDPNSDEIIRPILRGKDIKRYYYKFANLWLINTHNGSKDSKPIDIENYPAIKSHLSQYLDFLEKRQDKGKTPYNLRNCAYLNEFEKEKISWGNLALSCQFSLVEPKLYINNPSPFINTGDKYLLAVLNSTISDYYIRSLGVTRNGGYFEYKPMFVEKLPVPQISQEEKVPFETLASYVLFTTKEEQKLQAKYFEQIIDGLVYELYFPDEIQAANKDFLSQLGDLPILANAMSHEKKSAVIKNEFDRLYDPRHPVRNSIETLDSVEIVRIIRKALKK